MPHSTPASQCVHGAAVAAWRNKMGIIRGGGRREQSGRNKWKLLCAVLGTSKRATEHTQTTRLVSFRLARLRKVTRGAAVVGTFHKLIAQSAHRSQLTTRKHKQ